MSQHSPQVPSQPVPESPHQHDLCAVAPHDLHSNSCFISLSVMCHATVPCSQPDCSDTHSCRFLCQVRCHHHNVSHFIVQPQPKRMHLCWVKGFPVANDRAFFSEVHWTRWVTRTPEEPFCPSMEQFPTVRSAMVLDPA